MCFSFQRLFGGILLIGGSFTVAVSSWAAVGDTSIATWKDNFAGAISLTIDDTRIDRLDTLQILDDFGVKGTFYLDTRALQNSQAMLDGFLAASQNGHEIGSHSLTHPFLTRLSAEVIDAELRESQQFLENFTGKPVLSFAYPFGDDDESLRAEVAKYYLAARDVVPFLIHPSTGQDMFRLGETRGPFNWSDAQFIEQRMEIATETAAVGGWSIDMYHTLVRGRSNGEITHTEAALRGYLESLTTSDLSLWIAPLGEVAQYYLSREGVQISGSGGSGSSQEFTLNLLLDDPAGTIAAPLTLTTSLPAAWGSLKVTQGDLAIPFSVSFEGADQLITYHALPNGGQVVLSTIPEPTTAMLVSLALCLLSTSPHRHLQKRRVVPQGIEIGFVVDEIAEVAVDVERIG